MQPISALKIVLQKPYGSSLLPMVFLLASPQFAFPQTPQQDVCHMDSSGFCMGPEVQTTPKFSPTPKNNLDREIKPTPPNHPPAATNSPAEAKLEVEVRSGLLRLFAENISLRDALKALSAHTGAEIQFPAGALDERIFVHLGPATPREVVAQLLKGSHFNYVILSSNSDPNGMSRVILTRAVSTGGLATSVASAVPDGNLSAPQLYGAAYGADTGNVGADPGSNQDSPSPPSTQAASWIHHDGAVLSGEELDRMQKAQIEQEQQQFSQQLQQRQHQQDQSAPPAPEQ